MPTTNKLSTGCRVSGDVGPFLEATGNGGRRKRSTYTGLIIGSGDKEKYWRVYWQYVRLVSDHSARTLKFVAAPSSNIDVVIRQLNSGGLLPEMIVRD